MSDEPVTVTLALKPGSLEELLAGQYATRFWLHHHPDDPEGTYRLAALVWPNGNIARPSAEALLRVLSTDDVDDGRQPPIPDPTPEVAEQMSRWEALLESLPPAGPDDDE